MYYNQMSIYLLSPGELHQACIDNGLSTVISECRTYATFEHSTWKIIAESFTEANLSMPSSRITPHPGDLPLVVLGVLDQHKAHVLAASLRKKGYQSLGFSEDLWQRFGRPPNTSPDDIDAVLSALMEIETVMNSTDSAVIVLFSADDSSQ